MKLQINSLLKPVRSTFMKGVVNTLLGVGIVRESLPVLTEALVKRLLEKFPGFTGSVGSINFRFLSGRIEINDLILDKKITRELSEPFLAIRKIAIDLSWKKLWHKHIVGKVTIESPAIFVDVQQWIQRGKKRPDGERRQDPETSWQQKLKQLVPFKIEALRIRDGSVGVSNIVLGVNEQIEFHALTIDVLNISNSLELAADRTVQIQGVSQIAPDGDAAWEIQGDLLELTPSFRAKLKVHGFRLRSIQEIIRHFFGMNITQGIFELFLEAEGEKGQIQGYAKPAFDHLQVKAPRDSGLWQHVKTLWFQAMVRMLRNPALDRVTTRIKFTGTLEDTDINVLSMIGNFLKNAFGTALRDQLDFHVGDYFRPRSPEKEASYAADSAKR